MTSECAHRECNRPATVAYDVWSWRVPQDKQVPAHYEVCEEHADYFEGHFDRAAAQRVKQEMAT